MTSKITANGSKIQQYIRPTLTAAIRATQTLMTVTASYCSYTGGHTL